ncbi:MAG: hypothetical protein IKS19_08305 [Clostridia bacterium]|nr:hypothetical protein [Clostridia bacterium]
MKQLAKIKNSLISPFARAFIKRTNKKSSANDNVLLFCNEDTMIPHLLKYYNAVKDIGCRFFLCVDTHYGNRRQRLEKAREIVKGTKIAPVAGPDLYKTKWSLIVIPDLFLPKFYDKSLAPVLYINHGSHMISVDDGESTYAYSGISLDEKGEPISTAMLEPNRRIAETMQKDEKWKNIVVHVGCKDCGDILEKSRDREKYRIELGIKPDDIFVMCFGSWRRHSLFHYIDERFFSQAQTLMKEGYAFGLSIHPKEYRVYAEGFEPKGEYVDSMRNRGFIVRDPSQDYVPYLIASDVVITDFSTMSELAVLCGRKLIFSDFPKGRVWKHSMTAKLREVSPVLYDDSDLRRLLDLAVTTDVCDLQKPFKDEIFAEPSEYNRRLIEITKRLLKSGAIVQ